MRRWWAIAVVFVALAMVAAPPPAEARSVANPVGANGDRGDLVECPANEVLMGFSGRAGVWIDQIQLMCAPIYSNGTLGPTHVSGPAYGGTGGGPTANACNGSRLAQIDPELTGDNKKVAHIEFRCAAGGDAFAFGGSEIVTASIKARCGLFMGCDPDGVPGNIQGCVGSELPVGLSLRYGAHVNAVGLVCDQRQAIIPAKPIKSADRAESAQPTPAKPIKSTGRAAPTGPPIALRQTVTGPWKLVFDGGGTYLFQITAQNQGVDPLGRDTLPIAVSGSFSEQGEPADSAGGFGGSIQPDRQMIIQLGRKDGRKGSCALLYGDAQHLVGTCNEGGAAHTVNGTRASAADIAAAQPLAAPAPAAAPVAGAPAARGVTVAKAVDLYAAAGGDGEATGVLEAGTAGVVLVEPCQDDWCHVKWPGHEGWVYNGADYRSLKY